MKSKLLLLAIGVTALTLATPAFATTCASFTYTEGTSTGPTGCTIDGGDITFSAFSVTGLAPGATVTVSFFDFGSIGEGGVTFQPTAAGGTPYSVSYTASVTGGTFSAINDSATPGGVSTYTYSGSPFTCSSSILCNAPVTAGATSLTNSASYTGAVVPNETISLNFTDTAITGTPEPASLVLFGTGFLAIGLAARARRKRTS
jgi:PEP-CTERM motif